MEADRTDLCDRSAFRLTANIGLVAVPLDLKGELH